MDNVKANQLPLDYSVGLKHEIKRSGFQNVFIDTHPIRQMDFFETSVSKARQIFYETHENLSKNADQNQYQPLSAFKAVTPKKKSDGK